MCESPLHQVGGNTLRVKSPQSWEEAVIPYILGSLQSPIKAGDFVPVLGCSGPSSPHTSGTSLHCPKLGPFTGLLTPFLPISLSQVLCFFDSVIPSLLISETLKYFPCGHEPPAPNPSPYGALSL